LIIAIDGPAGSGKSSVAKGAALRLGFHYLDTGAMYRAVAVGAIEHGIALDDGAALCELALAHPVSFAYAPGEVLPSRVFIENRDVTAAIRSSEADAAVSPVSAHAELREVMLARQRELGASGNYVVEGRDIGTVVFPNAEVKAFLTAEACERARRRSEQNKARGASDSYEEVLVALQARDEYDSTREVAPLVAAHDATVLDTTELSQAEVEDLIVSLAVSAGYQKNEENESEQTAGASTVTEASVQD
jgi:cytidylate kinase